jgi:hypothetical protein
MRAAGRRGEAYADLGKLDCRRRRRGRPVARRDATTG